MARRPKILTPVSVQAFAEIELRDILNDFDEVFTGYSKEIKDKVEEEAQTSLKLYEDLFDAMTKGMPSKDMQRFINYAHSIGTRSDVEDKSIMVPLRRVMVGVNKLVQLPASMGQQSHQEFSSISGQFYVIYVGLTEIEKGLIKAGISEKILPTDRTASSNRQKPGHREKFSLAELARMKEQFRQLYISAKALAEMPVSMFTGDSLADIDRALEEYFKSTDQQEHLAKKVKQVDVLRGNVKQELKFEVQTLRSKAENLLGYGRTDIRKLGGNFDTGLRKVTNKYKNKFARLQGSNPLEGEIVKQFTDIAAGKKPKPYKSTSTIKKKATAVKPDKVKQHLKKTLAKAAAVKSLQRVVMPKKTRQSEGGVSNQRELNKLRMNINKRLPAEVRRNMGRPALINRTSTFSNSATLTELRQGPKTLIGKYTYMLNPYETFENEGQRQWPNGYNPKPLIAQSIRNLAMQYTEQKFTLRRD